MERARKHPAGVGYARGVFGRSWRIGTIGGIPVNVDSSWVWIAVLVVYSLWSRFDVSYGNVQTGPALAYAVLGAVLFFGSVFLHELAHAVVARASGIQVLGITLVFFGGFTSAKSDEKGPGPAFAIAAVGPGTSLALGALYWALSRATLSGSPLSGALGYVAFVNLLMAGFNLLPGLPLDGGRMLEAAVWRLTHDRERGARVAAVVGMGIAGLLVTAALFFVSKNEPFMGIWLLIIASFIFQAARGSRQQIVLRRRLSSATVADAMDPPPPAVPADMTLSEALDRFLRGHEHEAFPVVEEGRVIGMVTFGSAREVGMHDPLRPARDAVIPLENVLTASPDEPLEQVATRLGAGRAALVLRDGALVGAITGRGLARWATARS